MSESANSPSWQPWQMDSLGGSAAPAEDLQSAHRERLLRKAFQQKLEMQALREQAQDEARQAGHAQGHEQGYAQGLSEGRQAAAVELQARLEQVLRPLGELCRHFEQALEQLDTHIAAQLTRIALDTARQLVGEALTAQPAQVIGLVRTMLASHPDLTGKPRLRLNPDDLQRLQASLGEDIEAAGWRLQADPAILPGGCRLVSASGELDATCQSRWELLEQSAERALEQAQASLGGQP